MSNPTVPGVVQSLTRGLKILELVAKARRPVPVPELTRSLGIDRSSVFRLANTLRLHGFLAHAPGSKGFVLGSAVWRLANELPWSQTLTQIAHQHLASLAAATGETAHLAVREGRRALFVDHEVTDRPLGVAGRSGHHEPLHGTALGKALIADFDRPQLVELFGTGPLEASTKHTITSIDALAKECDRIRRRGYADDDQQHYEGVRCAGVPIRDASGTIIASIGISAPAGRLPKSRFGHVGKQVMAVAEQVSQELGYQPDRRNPSKTKK